MKSKVAMRREHIVNQVREILHKTVPTAKAILYGSEARGDAGEDVLTLKDQEAVAGPLYELELRTGVTISPTITLKKLWYNRPFKTPFYVNVMNEGIEL